MNENTRANIAKLLLRLTVGGLMLFHGIDKLKNGYPYIAEMLKASGLPEFLQYGVPVGEFVAPLCLILGVFTIPSGLLVAFTMLISIFVGHGNNMFGLNEVGGLGIELNLLYMFAAISIALLGSGSISLGRKLFNNIFLR